MPGLGHPVACRVRPLPAHEAGKQFRLVPRALIYAELRGLGIQGLQLHRFGPLAWMWLEGFEAGWLEGRFRNSRFGFPSCEIHKQTKDQRGRLA